VLAGCGGRAAQPGETVDSDGATVSVGGQASVASGDGGAAAGSSAGGPVDVNVMEAGTLPPDESAPSFDFLETGGAATVEEPPRPDVPPGPVGFDTLAIDGEDVIADWGLPQFSMGCGRGSFLTASTSDGRSFSLRFEGEVFESARYSVAVMVGDAFNSVSYEMSVMDLQLGPLEDRQRAFSFRAEVAVDGMTLTIVASGRADRVALLC